MAERMAAGAHSPPRLRWGAGRVSFTSRSLLHDRMRLALSLGGMTFAVVLVLLLRGIMDGTVANSTAYIDKVGADIFVSQQGVTNMALASSVLPEQAVAAVAAPEVERAAGIIRVNMIARSGEARVPVQLVGYPVESGLGGPWALAAGRRPAARGEAVVDTVLAGELGIAVGDRFTMVGGEFVAVGLSSGTAAIAAKFVFVELSDAQALLRMDGAISFVLLDLRPGSDARAVAQRLAAASPLFYVATREDLSASDRDLLSDLFIGPINVMSTIGFLVGLAVVGLTMYTTTNERLRDFSVLKAIGAPNQYLFRTVIAQSLVIGTLGFGLGLVATLAAGPVVERVVPDIAVAVQPAQAARVLAAVLGMSLAAALVPVARIVRVDPLLVFKR